MDWSGSAENANAVILSGAGNHGRSRRISNICGFLCGAMRSYEARRLLTSVRDVEAAGANTSFYCDHSRADEESARLQKA
jgi:hypothetical protein